MDALRANEFLLRDKSGHTLARLGSTPIGTCLEILGKAKEGRATLCAGDESGSDLLLTTHSGAARAFLSAGGKMYESTDGAILPSLIIAQEGKGLVSATVSTDSDLPLAKHTRRSPTIDVLDANGNTLWTVP